MKTQALTAAVAVASISNVASATEYRLDPDHAEVGFRAKHMMVSSVRGKFTQVSGKVSFDEGAPEKTRIEVDIAAASVETGVAKRDDHLRSADFLEADKHPKLTFRSKAAKRTGPDSLDVTGLLTVRGVSREVVLKVEGITAEVKDPWGQTRRGATATTRINRKDFGLTWNAALEAGGVLVGDEVQIEIHVELLQDAPKPAVTRG